jgi:hypothetical protein
MTTSRRTNSSSKQLVRPSGHSPAGRRRAAKVASATIGRQAADRHYRPPSRRPPPPAAAKPPDDRVEPHADRVRPRRTRGDTA